MAFEMRPPKKLSDEEAQLDSDAVPTASAHSVTSPTTSSATLGENDEQRLSAIERRKTNEALHDKQEEEALDGGPPAFDDNFLVTFDGVDDPRNPMNWSKLYRWYITSFSSLLVFNATFASSAPSGLIIEIREYFGISREVGTLLISIFVAGYCVGPLLWGPLSEVIGRRPIFIISFAGYFCFQIGCALSKNTASIIIFRLLGGIMAASPLTNSASLVADTWRARERSAAVSIFALAPFAGPAFSPMCSGFLSVRGVDWRWIFWILTIFSGACLVLIVLTIPETHHPTILKHIAAAKRLETGDARWHAQIERNKITFGQRCRAILLKPWQVFFAEPMLIAITVYLSFIYGCLYLLFEAYPIVFSYPQPKGHGFNAGVSGLMFLPIFAGGLIACITGFAYYNPRYSRLIDAYAPSPVPPEERLPMCAVGGVLFTVSFFWFGWTSYASISFWSPMLAGAFVGVSLTFTFLSLYNYMIDTYLQVAASALAANTVCRSLFGAGFPLFATQMYETLNPRWASTLLGFIALILAPIPFLFYRYGAVLRGKSKYSMFK